MDNRLIFLYRLIIIISWGGTGFDKLSTLLIWCLKGESVLVGKSARMTASLDGNFPFGRKFNFVKSPRKASQSDY